MYTRLANRVGDGEGMSIFLVGFPMIAIVVIKPHFLLARPHILRPDFLKRFVDALIAMLHGLHGIARERHSGANLCKMGSLLVDGHWYATAVEGNAQGQPRYALALLSAFARIFDRDCGWFSHGMVLRGVRTYLLR